MKTEPGMVFLAPAPLGITFLGSGSEGNAALLELGGHAYLLDAGLSCRKIENAVRDLGFAMTQIEGVFVTHGHGDHIRGLATLLKRFPMPVLATLGTLKEVEAAGIGVPVREVMVPGQEYDFHQVRVWPFRVPHDALEPIGLRFESSGKALGVATDLGHITSEVLQFLTETDILCLESNYDEEMLGRCAYPAWLKSRIKGPLGHLPNIGMRGVLARQKRDLQHLILVHLSQESNTPKLAREAFAPVKGHNRLAGTVVTVAGQDSPTLRILCEMKTN